MSSEAPRIPFAKRLFNPYGLETRALVLYHVLVLSLAILTLDRIAAYRFLPASDSTEIILVGSPTCPHSRAVRSRLAASSIPFREVDSVANPIDSMLAIVAFQSLRVPIVVIGSEIIHGNQADRIESSLAKLGYDVDGTIDAVASRASTGVR